MQLPPGEAAAAAAVAVRVTAAAAAAPAAADGVVVNYAEIEWKTFIHSHSFILCACFWQLQGRVAFKGKQLLLAEGEDVDPLGR